MDARKAPRILRVGYAPRVAGGARYRLGAVLARGGTAEVSEAWSLGQGGFERRVVLKQLLSDLDPQWLPVFEEEARLLARLDHPGVVGIIDYGVLEGRPYQALERIDGEALSDLIDKAGAARPMPVAAALEVVRRVARTLHDLHKHRLGPIVHADLSPENVLVSWRGAVKLLDFGCAHWPEKKTQLPADVVFGKLSYLAPEQRLGQTPGPGADVFALGCILHFAIAGKSPLESESAREKVMEGVLPHLDDRVPTPVASLIRRACHPELSRRLESARAFISAVDAAVGQLEETTRGDDALLDWLESLKSAPPEERSAHRLEEMFLLDGAEEPPGPERLGQSLVISGGEFPEEDMGTVRASAPATAPPVETLVEVELPTVADNGFSEMLATPISHGGPAWPPLVGYEILVPVARAGNGELNLTRAKGSKTVPPGIVLLKRFVGEEAISSLQVQEGLLSEARAMIETPHANLVNVLDFGTQDGQMALILEYLAGRNLRRVLDDSIALGQKLDRDEILAITLAMGRGLEVAQGIRQSLDVPLDRVAMSLDPLRVFVSHSGEVKLVDFGFESAAERLLAMGPEHGSVAEARAAEVKNLGQTMFEMLVGSPPGPYERRSPTARHGRRDERVDQIVQMAMGATVQGPGLAPVLGRLSAETPVSGPAGHNLLARLMRRLYGEDIEREWAFARDAENVERADSSRFSSFASGEQLVTSAPITGDMTPRPVVEADIPTAPSEDWELPTAIQRKNLSATTDTGQPTLHTPVKSKGSRASGPYAAVAAPLAAPHVPPTTLVPRSSASNPVVVGGSTSRPSVSPSISRSAIPPKSTSRPSDSMPAVQRGSTSRPAIPAAPRATTLVSGGSSRFLQFVVALALIVGVAAGLALYWMQNPS